MTLKNRIIFYIGAGISLFIIILAGFGVQSAIFELENPGEAPLPAREGVVPKDAIFAWNWDGSSGTWFDVLKTEKKNVFHVTTYNYYTGSPAYIDNEGDYIVKKVRVKAGKEYYEENKWANVDFNRLKIAFHGSNEGWLIVGERRFNVILDKHIAKYNYVLIPDGWIYHYLDKKKTCGEKKFYKDGQIEIAWEYFDKRK